jgi:8-oxo-dGTP pyrophosphatase MutT (NUDIX family)
MTHHAGQIGFPGGRNEPGERSEDCAFRELQEELDVPRQQVCVLGRLSPVFVFASNHYVTPWVASCGSRPAFCPNPAEVEQLFEVPLTDIVDESRWQHREIERGRLRFRVPGIRLGDRHVWGATGVILGDLIRRLSGNCSDSPWKHVVDMPRGAVTGCDNLARGQ